MPNTTITDTYNALLTTTLKNYRKKLAIQIFSHIPAFFWLFSKGRKVVQDGGESLIVPLLYGENDTVKSYSGYDTLDLTPQEGMTVAQFNWKQLAGSVVIPLDEERKNSGKHQLINLLKAKVQQLEISFRNKLAIQMQGDGTGNFGKDILGFKAMIDATPATGTLGGINRATAGNEWWRNRSTVNTTAGSPGTLGGLLSDMAHLNNQLTEGNEMPDLILCDMEGYEFYERQLLPNQRFQNPEAAKAGFQTLTFRNATMFFDSNVDKQGGGQAEGTMLFINSQYINVFVDRKIDFFQTEFEEAYNQTAKAAKLLWMGNLTISNSRKQGIISDIS